MDISKRASQLGSESAFDVLAEVNARKRNGANIVNFCIGQPDFDTPQNIKDAAISAIGAGKVGYTDSAGLYEVRQSVARFLSTTRHIDVQPEHVTIANGAKPFIAYAILSTTDAGAGHEVIYPNPGFPSYESQIIASGAVPVPLPLIEREEFRFDIEALKERITQNTRLLILNAPQNPTGGVLDESTLKEVAGLCKKHDLWVYSDEIYSQLVYDKPFLSIASLPGMYERTIISDGASKSHAMTGWRMGFAANPILAPKMSLWITHFEGCANQISQWALKAALDGPQTEVHKMVAHYHQRRDLIVGLLNGIEGVRCLSPGGAFYVYPNVTKAVARLGLKNSEDLRKYLLDHGVAVLSDTSFGPHNPGENDHYLRLCYAASDAQIIEGMARMKKAIESAPA